MIPDWIKPLAELSASAVILAMFVWMLVKGNPSRENSFKKTLNEAFSAMEKQQDKYLASSRDREAYFVGSLDKRDGQNQALLREVMTIVSASTQAMLTLSHAVSANTAATNELSRAVGRMEQRHT